MGYFNSTAIVEGAYGKFAKDLYSLQKQNLYLDYVNDFLTVDRFGEFYGFPTRRTALAVINQGRKIWEKANG